MLSTITILLAATAAGLVGAQVSFNATTNTFSCPPNATAFCAGDSVKTNIIIRCGNGTAYPGNCNDNLAGLPPIGVKSNALCYQSSPNAGDAACSFMGTAYPDTGSPFKIPGSNTSSSTSSSTLPSTSAIQSSPSTKINPPSTSTNNASSTTNGYDYNGFDDSTPFTIPVTTTQILSLVTNIPSAPFPIGTPTQGYGVPLDFNGTVPNSYGLPTGGAGAYGTPMTTISPFEGRAGRVDSVRMAYMGVGVGLLGVVGGCVLA